MVIRIPGTRFTQAISLVAYGFGLRAQHFGFALSLAVGREDWFLSWFPAMPGRHKALHTSHGEF